MQKEFSFVTRIPPKTFLFPIYVELILGSDYISLEDARRQLNMLSSEEIVLINKGKVRFKVTRGISPVYIAEMFQIKGCNSEDTMTLWSDSDKILKHQSLN